MGQVMKTVHVAAAIIRRNAESNEVLAVKRGYGPMAGMWEFPGGKVESGESAEEACKREITEELQVNITNLQSFYTVEYDYESFHLSMECFFAQLAQEGCAEPVARDQQQDIRWVHRQHLARLEWMPADLGLIAALGAQGAGELDGPDELDGPSVARLDGDDKNRDRNADDAPTPSPAKASKRSHLLEGVDTTGLTNQETELVRRRRAIRKSMQGNKRSDTRPEILVRQRLREAGLTGYRLQWKKAPGRPDIAFPGRKVAIFVNGCFWHRCPHCHPSVPKRNTVFWEEKFRRNVARDQQAIAGLEALGWTAITIWECELKRDKIDATMERVIDQVRAATAN